MTYNFRYSKLAPNSILGFLFILMFVLVGLVISIIILFYILNYKILVKEGMFWGEHQKLVFISILCLPIIVPSLFSIIGSISYRHLIDEKSGVLDISNNYTILYYKGEEIRLEKNKFSISSAEIHFFNARKRHYPVLYKYTIKLEDKTYKLYESMQEAYELTTPSQRRKGIYTELSLSFAMDKLKNLTNDRSY
ncbi:hypothetical protein CTN00_00455 [Fusobacterium pseudoperiodonticum]|uniref:hypothetical protein n=1 Tax=Fusobacterium pseudoperiodonticum TaxID=2663009 RepID=UPI000C1C147C|nr:hypothetical protein [Fusobacterium pseudoperiodonticum]ATV71566.1 hypothetical protein CTN00_00455 [Fusobacterium pseudoperiodonticum]